MEALVRKLIWLVVFAMIAVACGEDEGGGTTAPTDSPTTSVADDDTLQIVGVNYAFQGVPETIPVGTELSFTNASEDEVHELVLIKIDDDETRSVAELLELPEEEAEEVTEFLGVSVAFPGEDGIVVDGDLELDEPGRYVFLCFIPTGADPEAFREAVESGADEAPEVEGGPPHFTQGMMAEVTVTDD